MAAASGCGLVYGGTNCRPTRYRWKAGSTSTRLQKTNWRAACTFTCPQRVRGVRARVACRLKSHWEFKDREFAGATFQMSHRRVFPHVSGSHVINSGAGGRRIPQRLKPCTYCGVNGRPKGRPLQTFRYSLFSTSVSKPSERKGSCALLQNHATCGCPLASRLASSSVSQCTPNQDSD